MKLFNKTSTVQVAPPVYTKMGQGRNGLNVELFIREETELKDGAHSQPFHIIKNEKSSGGKNTAVRPRNHLIRRFSFFKDMICVDMCIVAIGS